MPARTKSTASSATTPVSDTGWPASDVAPSWSRKPSAWWTSVSRSSLALPGTAGSATYYLCEPKTLLSSAASAGPTSCAPLSPEHPDDETFEGLLILRPEGRLFFVNAQAVSDRIAALVERHEPRVLALDLSRVPDIEYSALKMLQERAAGASPQGPTVWLVGLNPGVLEVVRSAGLDGQLGPDRLLFNARAAIARYRELGAEQ